MLAGVLLPGWVAALAAALQAAAYIQQGLNSQHTMQTAGLSRLTRFLQLSVLLPYALTVAGCRQHIKLHATVLWLPHTRTPMLIMLTGRARDNNRCV
jgi:hypothetical protein